MPVRAVGFIMLAALCSAQDPAVSDKAQRAAEQVRAGKPEAAVPLYRELAAAFPAEPSFAVNLAVAQYKAGQYRDAAAVCAELVRRRPDVFPAWLFLGASRVELGEAADAVEPLRKAVSMQPQDRNARTFLADALLALGRYAEAASQFEEVARAAPANPRALFGLARSYQGLADEQRLRLEQDAPDSAERLALTGHRSLARSDFARAYREYRQALRLNPRLRGIHAAIASIYERTGHPDWAAVERAREPAEGDPGSEPYRKGESALRLSRQALARLRELPPSAEGFEAAAREDETAGRYREAAAAWKEALKLSPGRTYFERQIALALCHANDCVSALPLVRELLRREPASAELNYLCGLALDETQNPREALPYFEAALKADSGLTAARAALGEALLRAGDPVRAIPHLEAAAAGDTDGSRHYQLARAYQAAGRSRDVAAALKEYRQLQARAADGDEPRITPPE